MKKILLTAGILMLSFPVWVAGLTVDFYATKVCFGDSTTLVNQSVPDPNDSIRKIMWDTDGDGRFNNETTEVVRKKFLTPGFHSVGLKIMTWGGEVRAIYKLVSVGLINIDFAFSTGCANQRISFTNTSVLYGDTASVYTWKFGDGTPDSHSQNPQHIFANAGTYNVEFSILSQAGCDTSVTKVVTLGPAPTLSLQFSGDTVFFAGDSVVVTAYGNIDDVKWSTGETTNTIVVKTAGYFWVRGYKGDCYTDRSFRTSYKQYDTNPVITNLFTPNGDSKNDFWDILNLTTVEPCDVAVYNRFGEKVFSDPDYRNTWDGTFKGKALPNDTYYYFVRCFDNVQYKGTVNILK